MKMKCCHGSIKALVGAIAIALFSSGSQAEETTIKEAAQEAVLKNPEVLMRWHAFKAATENIDVIKGRYRPRLDVSANVARERQKTPLISDTYTRSAVSLMLNQMLYDGSDTRNEVAKFSYAQRVRYNEWLDTTETIALEAMRAYVDVLRFRKLHQLAQDNYVQHRAVFEQIQQRVKSGVGRRVDLEQASGRLALAEANLLTEASNLHDVSARYQRIVGHLPPEQMADHLLLEADIPPGSDQALRLAYAQHPALQAAQENIVAAQKEAKKRNAPFYPRFDLRARHDVGRNLDGVDGTHNLTNVELVLNYDFYNGGIDKAAERQAWEEVNVAKDTRDKVCRDVRQTLYIAYNDVQRLKEQLTYLEQHQLSIEKARDAYRKQFDIGQRTLLDLLDTENELFEAKREYLKAHHDYALALGRTHAGMGNLLGTMGLQRLDTSGLVDAEERAAFDPDVVCPVDRPNQLVIDKEKLFAEAMAAAGLATPVLEPSAPMRDPSAAMMVPAMRALEMDEDGDGVADAKDKCPGTAKGEKVDDTGCPYKAILKMKGVNFDLDKHTLRPDAFPLLDEAVSIMKQYPDVKVEVAGHTDFRNTDEYNMRLSNRRAKTVVDYLVSKGIPADRLTAKGYGESQPVADNATEDGQARNRRVEFRIIKK